MDATDFLFARPVPGSDTCILIGRISPAVRPLAEANRLLLWVVDGAGLAAYPGNQAGKSWTVVRIDQCSKADLEKAVDEFFTQTPKHLPSVYVTRDLPPAHAERLEQAIDIVGASLETNRRVRLTRQQDAFGWQRNLLRNLSAYTGRLLPDTWAGALAGLPAFVCGAGPSLDVSVPALARVASQGVVLAGDSSLKALAKRGIEADFAVSVDVAKVPAKCLPEVASRFRVVLSAVSPPEWSSAIPETRRYYVSSHQLTLDWLASIGVPRTKVEVCENCGSTAIELARFLGCSPICLFGMDLAMNADGPVQRHHGAVDSSIYLNSGFDAQHQFPTVPGNFSAKVPTHVYGDWRALDRRLASWPKENVWVVTDRGARLSNTTVVRPEALELPAARAAKESLLRNLAEPLPPSETVRRQVASGLEAFGNGLVNAAPGFRQVLETSGPSQLAQALCGLFATPQNGRLLGAFSLKLMPHLLPPIGQDVAPWRQMLEELENLGVEARNAAAGFASSL